MLNYTSLNCCTLYHFFQQLNHTELEKNTFTSCMSISYSYSLIVNRQLARAGNVKCIEIVNVRLKYICKRHIHRHGPLLFNDGNVSQNDQYRSYEQNATPLPSQTNLLKNLLRIFLNCFISPVMPLRKTNCSTGSTVGSSMGPMKRHSKNLRSSNWPSLSVAT